MSNKLLDLKYSTILRVALPMMVSGFIQSIVLITDTAFVSRYSIHAFDAVGNGGLAYITFYMVLLGMSDGAQIIMARRIGESDGKQVGRILNATWIVLFVMAILLFTLLYFFVPDWIAFLSNNKEIGRLQGVFIRHRSYALFFGVVTLGLQAYYLSRGKTWVVLISALLTATSNIVLDYYLVFGIGPFPKMGVAGAATASSIADGLGMVFILSYTLFSKDRKEYQVFTRIKAIGYEIKELLRVGTPLMIQGFAALFTWTVFFMWIEQMGQHELTVSQNIRSIYFLAFVPIWGFAGTTKTYISQYIGANRQDALPKIQRRIQFLTLCFMTLSFHGAILYPETLISWINPDPSYNKDSAEILRLIVGSILLYGFISVYFQTIHGSGNTVSSMIIEFVSVSVYIASAYLFIKVWHFDILHVWTIEYIYFGTIGTLSILYLRLFKWNQKKI